MFKQSKYQGYNVEKMEIDFKKLVKRYMSMGNKQKQAEEKSASFIDYYKHQYRVYS